MNLNKILLIYFDLQLAQCETNIITPVFFLFCSFYVSPKLMTNIREVCIKGIKKICFYKFYTFFSLYVFRISLFHMFFTKSFLPHY